MIKSVFNSICFLIKDVVLTHLLAYLHFIDDSLIITLGHYSVLNGLKVFIVIILILLYFYLGGGEMGHASGL